MMLVAIRVKLQSFLLPSLDEDYDCSAAGTDAGK